MTSIQTTTKRFIPKNRSEEVYYQYFKSRETSDQIIFILHDFFDYHKRYRALARKLAKDTNSDVCLFDFIGFGMSGGKRGQVDSIDELSTTLGELVDLISRETKPYDKLAIIGVGLGGLVSVDFLLNKKDSLKFKHISQILVNPFFKMNLEVSKLLESFIVKKLKINYFVPQYNIFENNSNVKEAEKLYADPLAIKGMSQETFKVIRTKSEEIKNDIYFLEDRTFFMVGSLGKICDNYLVKLFSKVMPTGQSKIKEYVRSGHDLLHDVERNQAIKDIEKWLIDL